jgi:vancomycin resistance protein YoaR
MMHQLHLLSSRLNFDKDKAKKYLKWLGVAALVFCIASIIYHLVFAHRIIPGVTIGKIRVGGLTYAQAKETLKKTTEETKKELQLKYYDASYSIKSEDIDLKYNLDAAVTRAFEVGRTGDLFRDNKDKLAGLVKTLYIKAFNEYDEETLKNKVLIIKGEINIPEIEAKYALDGKDLLITKEANGKAVDGDKLNELIAQSLNDVDFSPINIPVEITEPQARERNLNNLKQQAKEVVYNDLTIKYQEKSWNLTPQQKLDLLRINVDKEAGTESLGLDKDQFEIYTNSIGLDINKNPKGHVEADENGKVTKFELVTDGIEIDNKKFVSDFKAAFIGKQKTVDVTTQTVTNISDTNKYGIYALLGEGKSKYTGSIASRIKNLTLAAERTNGVLIAPGGTYSFNKAVGEISGRNGYDAAYVIQNGRTVLGEGGGVCQTSTTLFRAALNAGLPIVTRFPHAYRVKYYELESPVGIDAAVYQPSLDFQFKNDTPNYILIQTISDPKEFALAFKIYGTPDGRTVTMTEPVVTNVTAPPAALYQDDPNLAKGVVRQVDFSAWGATAQFSRTVMRDGETLYKDTFTSRYQAWRAVYLRGTKE